jgi:hypothetical protein
MPRIGKSKGVRAPLALPNASRLSAALAQVDYDDLGMTAVPAGNLLRQGPEPGLPTAPTSHLACGL